MNDEREFQNHKRDFIEALSELGIQLPEARVEEKLRHTQARAQEHGVSMSDVERENLRRAIFGAREQTDGR